MEIHWWMCFRSSMSPCRHTLVGEITFVTEFVKIYFTVFPCLSAETAPPMGRLKFVWHVWLVWLHKHRFHSCLFDFFCHSFSLFNWSEICVQIFTLRSLLLKVLLYDLRSSRPLLVKDHFYNLPIKSLNFHEQLNLVVSADSKIIKIWSKDTVSFPNWVYQSMQCWEKVLDRLKALVWLCKILRLSKNLFPLLYCNCRYEMVTGILHWPSTVFYFYAHRARCSPPYSLRPTSTMFACTLIQVNITKGRVGLTMTKIIVLYQMEFFSLAFIPQFGHQMASLTHGLIGGVASIKK